ncbi:MAG TPA: hypothetical protein VLJ17_24490 [Xanthobacteraceae bacterium]|nr:hypothetical protein [Xanthobacteraceae bacterium]
MTPSGVSPGQPPSGVPGQQPPMGSSPVTQGTPNRGYEAAGLQRLGLVVKQLGELVPLLGPTSDAGVAVIDALRKLTKFVPSGSVTPAGERNQLQSQMEKNAQNNQQMQALRQSQQQQPGAGQPPARAA